MPGTSRVGAAVRPDEYALLSPLAALLEAELAATRKVTDNGWAPRSRQVGITGRSIAPRLYVALGLSGKFNHVVGVRGAPAMTSQHRRSLRRCRTTWPGERFPGSAGSAREA